MENKLSDLARGGISIINVYNNTQLIKPDGTIETVNGRLVTLNLPEIKIDEK